jgi:hypothetical protein
MVQMTDYVSWTNKQIKDFGPFPYSRDSDLTSTAATINELLTDQMRFIRLTNQMRLIYQINQSDAFDISD